MSNKEYFSPDPDLITTSRQSIELTVTASTIAGFALSAVGMNVDHIMSAVLTKMVAIYPSIPEDELMIYAEEGARSAIRFTKFLGIFRQPSDGGLQ